MRRRILVMLPLAAVLLTILVRARGAGYARVSPADLDELALAGRQRLLVIAPHCDDEIIGAAGLIRVAQRMEMEVRVVLVTNGDGSLSALLQRGARTFPRYEEFVRLGGRRQRESLRALQSLGISPGQVHFLGYPDRGLAGLWNEYWLAAWPYRSTYTGFKRSPYALTYNPRSVYAGEDLLADLRAILAAYQPDLVIYPHPNDAHPDHWSLSNFARLALVLLQQENPDYAPEAYGYLVHWADFPAPRGLLPHETLLPPLPLLYGAMQWFRLDLNADDIAHKQAALEAFSSQFPVLRDLLMSFARRNECFGRVDPVMLPTLSDGQLLDPATWRDLEDESVGPVQRDPVKSSTASETTRAADLVALYAGQRPNGSLALCAQVWGHVERPLVYVLRVVAIGPEGVGHYVARWGQARVGTYYALADGHYVCTQIPWSTLGNPRVLLVSAEVQGLELSTLDRIAWQVLTIPSWRQTDGHDD